MSGRACLVAAALAAAAPCPAQTSPASAEYPRGKISGHVFADYYYNLVGDPRHSYNAAGADTVNPANIDGVKTIGKDLNGFQIRRIYFQVDNDLAARVATRFRLEADGRSLTSDGKIGVSVKAAYLQAKEVVPRGDVYFGIFSTPTWEGSEGFWQYRSVERTIADFRGLGAAADLGAELKGHFDAARRLGYAAAVANGLGQKPEDNRYKKFYLTLPLRFGEFRIEPYVDYEDAPGSRDRATYKVFAGIEWPRAAMGVEALDRVNHRPAGGNVEPVGYSFFARGQPRAGVAAFARLDLWQPDRRAVDRVDSQLWIAGFDWQPVKDVHFIPNVEATRYQAKGAAVAPAHRDLQARLTVYYQFSRP